MSRKSPIEDLYPLSPMQEGMLFHALYETGSRAYVSQFGFTLAGELDADAFAAAWQGVMDRHPALRTVFAWERVEKPLQVVRREAVLPVLREDWRGLPEPERESRLAAYLEADRAQGFDLARGPLMRVALFRVGEATHDMVWTHHHLIVDGWSLGLVYRDVVALYRARVEGREPPPSDARPYRDYVAWLGGRDPDRSERFWRSALAGVTEPTPLGIDTREAPPGSPGAAEAAIVLLPDRTAALDALARGNGLTTSTLVQGAWALLLSRYSGEEDVLFGTTVSGRPAELDGAEEMVGLFINALPIRARVTPEARALPWLRALQEHQAEMREHEHTPLVRVQEWSEIPRGRPLFESFLSFQNFPVDSSTAAVPGLRVEGLWGRSETNHPLTLSAELSGSELSLHALYAPSRFAPAAVRRLLEHLAAVLDSFAAHPEACLGEVSVLAPGERDRLRRWSAGPEAPPAEGLAHEVFESWARRTPGAVAVEHGGGSLTYAELDRRANRLAHALLGRGVGRGGRVGVCLEAGPEVLVAVLGAWKAGAAYVPLDPEHPAERLEYVAADAAVPVIVTRSELAGRVLGGGAEVLALDDGAARVDAGPDGTPGIALSPRELAYVIYTSGSTGRPKGVLVEHASLAGTLLGAREALGFGPGDVSPGLSGFAFDIWLFESVLPLLAGGRVRTVARERVLDSDALLRELDDATVLHAVPALMRQVVDACAAGAGLPRLRHAFVGGDAVPPALLAQMRAAFPSASVSVLYGPTEAAVVCARHALAGGPVPARNPVGRPLPGAALHVLGAADAPAPAGVAGELCVGGPGVARGYLGRADLTAERFVPDPFAAEPGARMYRSGDRARWTEEGTLEFLGRLDHQVKVRGFRVEPGEVEAALARHAAVRDAVVAVREDAHGERRLVAYVVAAGGAEAPPAAGLREHLRGILPEHMVPSAFVTLEALPLSPNGKVDRRALPAPEAGGGAEAVHVAPRSPVEELLAGIWRELLREERIGVHDSFFALGGHSLTATRMVSRARAVLGVDLAIRHVFEGPTVAELAARAEEALRDRGGAALPPLERVPRDRPLPLSFGQQRLWVIHQMDPSSGAYNHLSPFRVRGRLDVRALERALEGVVRRHEALRTVFPVVDGDPVQEVREPGPVPLPLVDLRGAPREAREAEVRALALAEAARPFDLLRGPVFRATLLRVADDEHVVLFTLHHVVSDGWSMGVLVGEVTALYEAHARGGEPGLPPLPVQYADFAVWQRAWLSGEPLEAQLAWWRERLAGAPPLLELPTDRPRPAVAGSRGAGLAFLLPPEVTRPLRALAQKEGATLFMTLLSAWQLLLARWSGQDDLCVGTAVAGRTRPEVEGLIGFFVNTLVLRGDLSGDRTFRELLGCTREAALGAYAHQDLPFERLVDELRVDRSLGHSPLFQVMFALENVEPGELRLGDAELEPVPLETRTAKFDLTFGIDELDDGLQGVLRFRPDLWDASTVERMLGHWRVLLEGIAATGPGTRVSDLPLLAPAERERVLEEWNATEAGFPLLCAHERFEEQARLTPDAAAVVYGGRSLSYAALDRRADALAVRLHALGVRPEARVGVLLERGVEMVAAVLAVLKAGGAYVALDPSHPDERLLFVLEDAGARVVLTDSALAGRIGGFGGVAECLDRPEEADLVPPERLRPPVSPDNLAYVVYTSGSTGAPKGVLVAHRGLSNYLAWFDREVLGEEGFDLPLVSRLSFDAHVRQLFPPLLRGEAVWVLPEETVADPARLLEALSGRERVSFGGVPSLWSAMVERVRSGEGPKPRGLEAVLLGGEALPDGLVERTRALFPGAAVWNHYGPTEATVNTTAARVDGAERVGIGRPVANVRVYLLDAYLGPVPVGVPGELFAGGAGVARGYLGRPELTAERFVPDPFSRAEGARMYRSGDRARWLDDGTLEYLGRTDRQVKLRGFRVEPGEVEAALASHPAVRGAAVVARDERLVGYVAAESGGVSVAELREHARGSLPEHMVPSVLVVLDALPLTPSGKVDRRALPEPGAGEGAEGYVAPRTPVEEIVAAVWAEVLGVARVGAHDDFFEIGGHSLLATRAVSRVRAALGVDLPLRALFEAPTVAGLSGRAEAARREGAGPPPPPIRRVPRDGPLPLSFAQQRLWLLQQVAPESVAYNMPYALRLRGAPDHAALRRALRGVVERHEALRTVFRAVDGEPAQVVQAPGGVPLPLVELERLGPEARGREAARLAAEEAARPFDLARGPTLRTHLLRLAGEEHVLLFTLHHVVSDGWSTGVLLRDVAAFHDAYVRGGEPSLPALPVQYADYAVWQRAWLAGEVLEAQIAWWRERLAGAPPLLELPTDRPRPAVQSERGGWVPLALPDAVARALRAFSRRQGATLHTTLLAAWQLLLSRWSGEEDLCVGLPIAGRGRPEVEELIGFFVNTLVIRADLGGDPSFRALLGRTREAALGAYAHSDLPFERLVEALGVERSLGHTPLFQAVYAPEDPRGREPRLAGLEVEPLETGFHAAKLDLVLTLGDDGERVAGSLSYRTELFDAATAARMAEHLEALLEGIAADPDRPASALPLLRRGEEERLLAWSGGGAAADGELSVHEVFAARVAEAPDAPALESGGEVLTYAELDRRAALLAAVLAARGVRVEARVGVCLERGPEMVVAFLATLRAGGAYVPLDPAYPAERLAWMMEDSGVRVVLAGEEEAGRVSGFGGEVVVLGGDGGTTATPEPDVLPDNLAYVIYTSGSTGRPKGVAVTHRGVVRLVRGAGWGIGAGDRVAQVANASFDAATFEIWGALLSGACLVVVPRETVLSPPELVAELRARRVGVLVLATALFNRVAAEVPDGFRTVRDVLCGGEAADAEAVRRVLAAGGPGRLLNVYGPTESTSIASRHVVDADAASSGAATLPIGVPIPDTRLLVLDRELRPAPTGVPGELYVGGGGVARGYLGRPELTAERFVPDPCGPAGERLYRTGDRARWLPSGVLEFLGRLDGQVKIRGFRVEPGEVEAALASHPAVREAAVVARDERLVGYVVAESGGVSMAELLAHLRARLPGHMVPASVSVLDRLPLTPNGKLDRRALPEPDPRGAAGEYLAPRTAVEEALCGIWSELLRVERVGARDGFFALGGHSLLATQAVARVRDAFGVELPLRALFEVPDVAGLAREVERLRAEGARAEEPRIARVPRAARPRFPRVS